MQVIITPKAQKHYEHLPKKEQTKIKKKFLALENDPLYGKKLAGELKEQRSLMALVSSTLMLGCAYSRRLVLRSRVWLNLDSSRTRFA